VPISNATAGGKGGFVLNLVAYRIYMTDDLKEYVKEIIRDSLRIDITRQGYNFKVTLTFLGDKIPFSIEYLNVEVRN
jgi:hypothetical protein